MIPETVNQAIGQYLSEYGEALADLLIELVAIPSVTGNEGAVQARIGAEYQARGLETAEWVATPEEMARSLMVVGDQPAWEGRPNVVGVLRGSGGSGARSLILQGHCDTVDPGDSTLWQHNPAGELYEGNVFGRGACDMKGGLVVHLMALDALRTAGVQLRGDVILASTVGEEDGGVGALSLVKRGYRADAVIITEPTNRELVVAQGGSLVFRIIVTGRSAHGAARNEGISAFEKFLPIHQMLLDWEAERNRTLHHPLYDHFGNKFPISVGVVRAGTWASTVPEVLVAEGRLGFLPGETIDDMQRETERRVLEVANTDSWLRGHQPLVEWFGGQFASAEVAADEPIAVVVANAHHASTGADVKVAGVTWGADMRHFVGEGEMPTVLYGAGDVRNVHCPDEYVPLDDLIAAAHTIALAMVEWCGIDEQLENPA